MTRKQAKTEMKFAGYEDTFYEAIIDKIYDDFEEELKKAYIEGGNDAWKAIKEKKWNIEKSL